MFYCNQQRFNAIQMVAPFEAVKLLRNNEFHIGLPIFYMIIYFLSICLLLQITLEIMVRIHSAMPDFG